MRFQCGEYCSQYTIEVGQYVGIPKSQSLIAVGGEKSVAPDVVWIVRMLPAIHFDNELSISTNEIGDIGGERLLANKFVTTKPAVAQRKP